MIYEFPMDVSGAYVNSLFESDTVVIAYTDGDLALSFGEETHNLIPISEIIIFRKASMHHFNSLEIKRVWLRNLSLMIWNKEFTKELRSSSR